MSAPSRRRGSKAGGDRPFAPRGNEEGKMRHNLKRLVGRLMALVLSLIGAVGLGQTGAADNSARTLTIGAGSADALDPRNPPFNAIPNDGQRCGVRLCQQ